MTLHAYTPAELAIKATALHNAAQTLFGIQGQMLGNKVPSIKLHSEKLDEATGKIATWVIQAEAAYKIALATTKEEDASADAARAKIAERKQKKS